MEEGREERRIARRKRMWERRKGGGLTRNAMITVRRTQ